MAGKSHLDELIDYKEKIIDIISGSQETIALIANNPNIVLGSEEAYKIIDENIFSYDYINSTQITSKAFIMVDVDMVRRSTSTMKDLEIYVQIVVDKSYMNLKECGFKGIKGNRRDNILRYVDLLLNGNDEFGIGQLELQSAVGVPVPDIYTSKMLTYAIVNFAQNRKLGYG